MKEGRIDRFRKRPRKWRKFKFWRTPGQMIKWTRKVHKTMRMRKKGHTPSMEKIWRSSTPRLTRRRSMRASKSRKKSSCKMFKIMPRTLLFKWKSKKKSFSLNTQTLSTLWTRLGRSLKPKGSTQPKNLRKSNKFCSTRPKTRPISKPRQTQWPTTFILKLLIGETILSMPNTKTTPPAPRVWVLLKQSRKFGKSRKKLQLLAERSKSTRLETLLEESPTPIRFSKWHQSQLKVMLENPLTSTSFWTRMCNPTFLTKLAYSVVLTPRRKKKMCKEPTFCLKLTDPGMLKGPELKRKLRKLATQATQALTPFEALNTTLSDRWWFMDMFGLKSIFQL